jgi:uncharacterized protein (TIGR02117 family)
MGPMRRSLTALATALALVLAAAGQAAASFTVYVSSNGWHTDIAIARADVPAERLPEKAHFPEAVYLQFGWGDADFYTEPEPGIGTTLGTVLPGPAVVHLAGLAARPSLTFRDLEEVRLTLNADQFTRLVDYLDASFDRSGERTAAPGIYAFSRFYPATGEFHLFNTCNTWTARALAAADLDVDPSGVQTAGELMRQLPASAKD